MLTGRSPMGTAGGAKTTTIAVLDPSTVAYLREKRWKFTVGGFTRAILSVQQWFRCWNQFADTFTMSVLLSAAMPEADPRCT